MTLDRTIIQKINALQMTVRVSKLKIGFECE